MNNQILTVSELNKILKSGLENDQYLKNLYVTGEISNLTLNKSGHIYFSIKDEGATINCMIWKDNANSLLKLNPKEGMKITCLGRITYYIPTGRISLEVRDVKLEGKGELQQIFDQRYQELEKLGWFDQSIKKQIPKFPKNIGIITADTGAAIHDLITTINRRYPIANIFLFPSQVQGEIAQFDIAKKIKQANMFEIKIDVLIVGRGGGSYEDLWSFNEMPVLQAIKNSIIPIISAVGHQPDFTLADYVADIRAATPTAAGEIVTPSIQELKMELDYNYHYLKRIIKTIYSNNLLLINDLNQKVNQIMINQVNSKENYLKFDFERLNNSMNQLITKNENELNLIQQKLELLNPTLPLKKGFSLITNNKGEVISKLNSFKLNENIFINIEKGQVNAKVIEIKKEK